MNDLHTPQFLTRFLQYIFFVHKIVTFTQFFSLIMSEELQYINIIKDILLSGEDSLDRTGVGTRSIFGVRMKYSLANGKMPLLTTKKMAWKSIVEELMWFISGNTNSLTLENKGVNIWRDNTSREYLDSIGLTYNSVGDAGPIYGFQWRHFGAKYIDSTSDYTGKGVDQLAWLVNEIKTNPTSRRLVLCAWNPVDIPKMALPPCHVLCQFHVRNKKLSCQLYQRSGDMGLGVPFNIASYALLTHLIAHTCELEAHELIHVIGDAHIYLDHIDALVEQTTRQPYDFPTIKIDHGVTVFDACAKNIQLIEYKCHPSIHMKMAI